MATPLRVGVVGCGNVALNFHVPAYRALPGRYTLVGLADPARPRTTAGGPGEGRPHTRAGAPRRRGAVPLPADSPLHRLGVLGLRDLSGGDAVPDDSPVRRRSLFGVTPTGA